MFFGYFEVC